MDISNDECISLFELKKYASSSVTIDFPISGNKIEIELENDTGRIKFQGDISRGNSITRKLTFQLRHKNIFIIRRLDFNGNHKNPPAPAPDKIFEDYIEYSFEKEDHIHFYFEGYGERWALPLSSISDLGINPSDDIYDKMVKFFNYCNVEKIELKVKKTLLL